MDGPLIDITAPAGGCGPGHHYCGRLLLSWMMGGYYYYDDGDCMICDLLRLPVQRSRQSSQNPLTNGEHYNRENTDRGALS